MTSFPLLRAAAAAGVIILALGACGGDDEPTVAPTVPGATGSTTNTVEVKDFAFNPAATTVRKGATVTWSFADDVAHNVTPVNTSELQKSPDEAAGGKYEFTFNTPGTVAYRCGIHAQMTGTVVVTA